MDASDAKVVVFNTGILALAMTQIEPILKITLLVVSIGYTVHRWINIYKHSKHEKKD